MIAFTIFDFVFFISFIFFSLRGFLNGVVKELLSLLIWLSSLALAWGLRQFPINFFEINSSMIWVETLFFIFFFILFYILFVFIFKAITFAFNPKTFILNSLGFFIGIFKFNIFTIILFLTAEEYIIDQNWWSSSMVSPYIIDSANLVGKMIGELPAENIENLTIEPSKLID